MELFGDYKKNCIDCGRVIYVGGFGNAQRCMPCKATKKAAYQKERYAKEKAEKAKK